MTLFKEGTTVPFFIFNSSFFMELADEIRRLTEGALTNERQFVVDVAISSRKAPRKILVVVDGDRGITIDDCADISNGLSKALDDANIIDEKFMLEVSTPGLDQPLKLHRQYKKNIGRVLKVKHAEGTTEGTLTAVDDNGIELQVKVSKKETKATTIAFAEIEKAFVTISFK